MGKMVSWCLFLVFILITLGACTENKKDEVQENSNQEVKKDEGANTSSEDKKIEQPVVVTEPVVEVKEPIPLTSDEIAYKDIISKSFETFGQKMDAISVLTTEAESNPLVTASEDWQNQIKGNFMTITVLTSVLADMKDTNSVPVRFEVAHEYSLNALTFMSNAGDKVSQSIDNGNDEILMLEGKELIDESNREIEKISAEYDRITLELNGGVEEVSTQDNETVYQEQLAKDFEIDMENFNAHLNINQDSMSPIIASMLNEEQVTDEESFTSMLTNLNETILYVKNMQDYSQIERYKETKSLFYEGTVQLIIAYSHFKSFYESEYNNEDLFSMGLESYNKAIEEFKLAGSMYAQEKQQQ